MEEWVGHRSILWCLLWKYASSVLLVCILGLSSISIFHPSLILAKTFEDKTYLIIELRSCNFPVSPLVLSCQNPRSLPSSLLWCSPYSSHFALLIALKFVIPFLLPKTIFAQPPFLSLDKPDECIFKIQVTRLLLGESSLPRSAYFNVISQMTFHIHVPAPW